MWYEYNDNVGVIYFTWVTSRLGGGDVPKEIHKLFNEYISNPFYEIDLKRFIENI